MKLPFKYYKSALGIYAGYMLRMLMVHPFRWEQLIMEREEALDVLRSRYMRKRK